MGFASNSCSFTRFRILDPVTDEMILQIPDRLKKFAFQDIDNLPEMRSFGWVSFEDMLDSAFETAHPQKADYMVFALRVDTRRIPAGVIKKHLELALRREKMNLANQKFISRERKKEIREQVILALKQRFLPVPAVFDAVWNPGKNQVWFASIQSKMIDLFMEVFLNTFELHLEELNPCNLASGFLTEEEMGRLDMLDATSFVSAREAC